MMSWRVYCASLLFGITAGRQPSHAEVASSVDLGSSETLSFLQREAKATLGFSAASANAETPAQTQEEVSLMAMLENRVSGVFVDAPESLKEACETRPPQYLFSVNTGHAGSTSLSQADAYSGGLHDELLFGFESIGWQESDYYYEEWLRWWDGNPDKEEQFLRVQEEFKPRIDQKLRNSNKTSWVDIGHHTVHGIFQQLPHVFAPNLVVMRLRRDRYHTAFSFSQLNRDLCKNMFRICPVYNKAVLHPSSGKWTLDSWAKVEYGQQAYWYVDEVEAQWQLLIRANPQLPRFECDWTEDMEACFSALAVVLHVQVSKVDGQLLNRKQHTFGGFTDAYPNLKRMDQEYKALMSYSPQQIDLINKTYYSDVGEDENA